MEERGVQEGDEGEEVVSYVRFEGGGYEVLRWLLVRFGMT